MLLTVTHRWGINATEMDVLRGSARISELDRKKRMGILEAKWTRKIRYWLTYPENNSFGKVMAREWTQYDCHTL
jgi:hypothetical protein